MKATHELETKGAPKATWMCDAEGKKSATYSGRALRSGTELPERRRCKQREIADQGGEEEISKRKKRKTHKILTLARTVNLKNGAGGVCRKGE